MDVGFQISLPKLELDRWWTNAVSMSRVLQLTVISGADVVSFGVQNMSFGMVVVVTLAPWGTIGRSRGTWVHVWEFLANFGATYVFFFMLVSRSRFSMILGSESGRQGF